MAHKLLSTTMIASIKCHPNLQQVMWRCMSSSSPTGLKVGFIGLGQMGNRMATNLIKKVRLQPLFGELELAKRDCVCVCVRIGDNETKTNFKYLFVDKHCANNNYSQWLSVCFLFFKGRTIHNISHFLKIKHRFLLRELWFLRWCESCTFNMQLHNRVVKLIRTNNVFRFSALVENERKTLFVIFIMIIFCQVTDVLRLLRWRSRRRKGVCEYYKTVSSKFCFCSKCQ